MISRETENVKSSEEIESAFRALSAENKPYVTKEELYQVRHSLASVHYKLKLVLKSANFPVIMDITVTWFGMRLQLALASPKVPHYHS